MKVRHRTGDTYLAVDDRCTYPVPPGIETIETVTVNGKRLEAGPGYAVTGKHFAPKTLTLKVPLQKGDSIYIAGVAWMR